MYRSAVFLTVNDLTDFIDLVCILYADGAVIYVECTEFNEGIIKMQHCMEQLTIGIKNGLTINFGKTKAIYFTQKIYTDRLIKYNLYLKNARVLAQNIYQLLKLKLIQGLRAIVSANRAQAQILMACHSGCGTRFYENIINIRPVLLLAKLRLGVSQSFIARLFNIRSQLNISAIFHRILGLHAVHFVPIYPGFTKTQLFLKQSWS